MRLTKRDRAAVAPRSGGGLWQVEALECRRLLSVSIDTLFHATSSAVPTANPGQSSIGVSATDLLQGLLPADTNYYPTFQGGPIANLTDGKTAATAGNTNEDSATGNAVFSKSDNTTIPPELAGKRTFNSDWYAEYNLPTTGAAAGWDLTRIDVVTGHSDTRTDQTVRVFVKYLGQTLFTSLTGIVPFSYRPGTGKGAGRLRIVDEPSNADSPPANPADEASQEANNTGAPIARSVIAVRVEFDEEGVYRELDVFGDASSPLEVTNFLMNGAPVGGTQRSMVNDLTFTFRRPVTLDAGAITLTGRNGAGAGTVLNVTNPSGDGRTYRVTFSGSPVVGGSLADGIYDLAVVGSKVHDVAIPLLTMTVPYTFAFHRLYSDVDGDGDSDNTDLFAMRGTYLKPSTDPAFRPSFDYQGDGNVDNADVFQVRSRRNLLFKLDPPSSGTIFEDPDIITAADPSAYVSLVYTGQGMRSMFDRRVNAFVTYNAYLFAVTYSDLPATVEYEVNPEYGTVAAAQAEVERFVRPVGQVPVVLRRDLDKVWIHKGDNAFGGGNRSLLIHTGATLTSYLNSGILEETFVHELSHTSLDADHAASPGWLAAQSADGRFISTYARDNPTREDVAETFLLWLAVRYRRDRISQALYDAITSAIPHRLAYFDAQGFNLKPTVP